MSTSENTSSKTQDVKVGDRVRMRTMHNILASLTDQAGKVRSIEGGLFQVDFEDTEGWYFERDDFDVLPGTSMTLQEAREIMARAEEIESSPQTSRSACHAPVIPAGAGPGAKDDTGKIRYDLIPTALEEGVARVLTYGAFQRPRENGTKGYGKNNWQGVEDAKGRYFSAMRRHIAAYRRGERNDQESGLSHLAHAATNLAFLLSFEEGHDPVL